MHPLEAGARNAVAVCMGVKAREHVLIITDEASLAIGKALERESLKITPSVEMIVLEQVAKRPLTSLPRDVKEALQSANVTFWTAESQKGELVARHEFLELVRQHASSLRHGHMPGVNPTLMEQGMSSDYEEVYALTHMVYDIVREAREITLSNRFGLDVRAKFDPSWRWKPSDGRYHVSGDWGNLPEGEVFTAPARVDGRIVTNLLGDWFSKKYGRFDDTLSFKVKDSWIELDSISTKNKLLYDDLTVYLKTDENSKRAGEFALPTNPLLISSPTIGNLLQDEKARPHIAFGDPYGAETGATWKSTTHVDMLMEECDVVVQSDGRTRKIMERGRYVI